MAASNDAVTFLLAIKQKDGFEFKDFELHGDNAVVVGRYVRSQVIFEHPGISNKHLELRFDPKSATKLAVRDLSSNGTGIQLPGRYDMLKLDKNALTPIPDNVLVSMPMIGKAKAGSGGELRKSFSVHLGTQRPGIAELEQLHAPPPEVAELEGGALEQQAQELDVRINEKLVVREEAVRQQEFRRRQLEEELAEQQACGEAEQEEERLRRRRQEDAEREEGERLLLEERRRREEAESRDCEDAQRLMREAVEGLAQEEAEASKRAEKDAPREKKKRKRKEKTKSVAREEVDEREVVRQRREREEQEEQERIAREEEERLARQRAAEQEEADREKESRRAKKKDRDRGEREDRKRRRRGDIEDDGDANKDRKRREREERERQEREIEERERAGREREEREREEREREEREREERDIEERMQQAREQEAREQEERRLREELDARERQEAREREEQEEQEILEREEREHGRLDEEARRREREERALEDLENLEHELEREGLKDNEAAQRKMLAVSEARLRELEEEDRRAWERAERERQLGTDKWDKRMEQVGAVEEVELQNNNSHIVARGSRSRSMDAKPVRVQEAQQPEQAGSSSRGVPSWVEVQAKALYYSEGQKKFFPVYISKIDERQKLVYCIFEDDAKVWKSLSFSLFTSSRCPLRPRNREQPKKARKVSRSRSATPEWWQMKEKKSMDQLIEEQEREARLNAEREAREQDRLRDERRRRELIEADQRRIQEAFEQRRKEAEAQQLRQEEEWRQQLREKRLEEAAKEEAEREASEEAREERRRKKRKDKEKRDDEERRKRKEEEAKERKAQEQEDAFEEAIMAAERKKRNKEQEKAAREAEDYMTGEPNYMDQRMAGNGQWNQWPAQGNGPSAWQGSYNAAGNFQADPYNRSAALNAAQGWQGKGNGWQGHAGASQIPAAFRPKAASAMPGTMPGAAGYGGGPPPSGAMAGKGYGGPQQPGYAPRPAHVQPPQRPAQTPTVVRPPGYAAGGPQGYPARAKAAPAAGYAYDAAQWQNYRPPSWQAPGGQMQARGMAMKGGHASR